MRKYTRKKLPVIMVLFLLLGSVQVVRSEDSRVKGSGMAAGDQHALFIMQDGTVQGLGKNDKRQCDTEMWHDIVHVYAGDGYSTGVDTESNIFTAGDVPKVEGEQPPMETWQDVIKVTGSKFAVFGLKRDGTVVGVGNPAWGIRGSETWRDIVDIQSDGWYLYGLTKEGRIVCSVKEIEEKLSNFESVQEISSYSDRVCLLFTDGTIFDIGRVDLYKEAVGERLPWENAAKMSARGEILAAIGEDGYVWYTTPAEEGVLKDAWVGVVEISVGSCYIVGRHVDGTFVAKRIMIDPEETISQWENIDTLASGHHYTLGLTVDGHVLVAGNGQTYDKDWMFSPPDTTSWTDIVMISAGYQHAAGLKSNGTVVVTNATMAGITQEWTDIVQVVAGVDITVGLTASGHIRVATVEGEEKILENLGDTASLTAAIDNRDYRMWGAVGTDGKIAYVDFVSTEEVGEDYFGWSMVEKLILSGDAMMILREDGTLRMVDDGWSLQDAYGERNVESHIRYIESLENISDVVGSGMNYTMLTREGVVIHCNLDTNAVNYSTDDWPMVTEIYRGNRYIAGRTQDGGFVIEGWNDYGQYQIENLR